MICMARFNSISELQSAIQSAMPDWRMEENLAVENSELGIHAARGTFSIWQSPLGEQIVVSLVGTSLTGSERPKPQIRIFTEKPLQAYRYACANHLRFFLLVYCATDAAQLKFSPGVDPSDFLVSIESKLTAATGGRLDIRSIYDHLETLSGLPYFRVTPEMHNCRSLSQASFLRLFDTSGVFTVENLSQYLTYFDSRPYMTDAAGGNRVVFQPSALYTPSQVSIPMPWNLLVHGAPGTGKSFYLADQLGRCREHSAVTARRVTFYEDYTYGQFVGEYLPVPREDGREHLALEYPGGHLSGTVEGERITYRFSPGPLAELLAKSYAAKLNRRAEKFVLIIEELNRANAASVFGDFFQLLDRENGVSIYEITVAHAMAEYLYEEVCRNLLPGAPEPPEDAFQNIRLPDNLYIWATMNSADQGVFPLDSAFKRRWSDLYCDLYEVDPANALRPRICLPVLDDATGVYTAFQADWNTFRNALNNRILDACFAEDRCIGYWFFKSEEMEEIARYTRASVDNRNGTGSHDLAGIPNPLVDKLLAYLVQDVFRHAPGTLFPEGLGTLSRIRSVLRSLQFRGENMDIRSTLLLNEDALVENRGETDSE